VTNACRKNLGRIKLRTMGRFFVIPACILGASTLVACTRGSGRQEATSPVASAQSTPSGSSGPPSSVPPPSPLEKHPSIELSSSSGPPGTSVRIEVQDCQPLLGQPDEITWHDQAHLQGELAYKDVSGVRRSGDTLIAVFVPSSTDAVGVGVLDALCGGQGGNATASFTVTSH
jgi:hypothetical protein